MSNKKTLLNEGTIRRFMKLANVDALTENYFENKVEEEEEEEVEEGMDLGEEDAEGEEEVEIGMDAEMGEPMDGLPDEGAAPDELQERLRTRQVLRLLLKAAKKNQKWNSAPLKKAGKTLKKSRLVIWAKKSQP